MLVVLVVLELLEEPNRSSSPSPNSEAFAGVVFVVEADLAGAGVVDLVGARMEEVPNGSSKMGGGAAADDENVSSKPKSGRLESVAVEVVLACLGGAEEEEVEAEGIV